MNEVGLNAVPWATAIEVLASPEKGRVSKWHCTRLIGQHEFSDRALRWKKCWVKTNRGRRHMTLAQRIFLRLYDARSKFVHGDKVSRQPSLVESRPRSSVAISRLHHLPHGHDGLPRRTLAAGAEPRTGWSFLASNRGTRFAMKAWGRTKTTYSRPSARATGTDCAIRSSNRSTNFARACFRYQLSTRRRVTSDHSGSRQFVA